MRIGTLSFYGLLSLLVVAHFAHHLLTAILVPLTPLIRDEFSLGYTQAGLMISAFSLSYGIGQLPAGWLADRIGPRILLSVGIFGVALAGLCIGFLRIFPATLVLLALMGVLGGGYHPAAPSIISSMAEPHKLGRVLGFHMIGGSASFFLAPIIATAIASTWGWRGSFVGLAVPALAFGAILYLLLGWQVPQIRPEGKVVDRHADAPRAARRPHRLMAFIILTNCMAAVFVSVISFIPLYMVDHFGVDERKAGALLGLIYSAGLWVSPLGGYLSDRLGGVRIILVVCLMAGPVIYLLNVLPYGWPIFILLTAFGVIIYIRMPVSESYIIEQAAAHSRSTLLGVYYFTGMEGGGLLTPAMGYLIDHLGFYLSFSIAGAALIVVTLLCSIWLRGGHDR